MQKIGNNSSKLLENIKQEHKDWHRAARGIIKLRKLYSDEVIDLACLRALHYGLTTYSKVKKILESNSYNLPLGEFKVGGEHANVA